MINKSLLLRLTAKPGKEKQLAKLLTEGLQYVLDEPNTINWYAFSINESTFGIFDTFPDADALHEHHTGKLAHAIAQAAPDLLAEKPTVEVADILAWK